MRTSELKLATVTKIKKSDGPLIVDSDGNILYFSYITGQLLLKETPDQKYFNADGINLDNDNASNLKAQTGAYGSVITFTDSSGSSRHFQYLAHLSSTISHDEAEQAYGPHPLQKRTHGIMHPALGKTPTIGNGASSRVKYVHEVAPTTEPRKYKRLTQESKEYKIAPAEPPILFDQVVRVTTLYSDNREALHAQAIGMRQKHIASTPAADRQHLHFGVGAIEKTSKKEKGKKYSIKVYTVMPHGGQTLQNFAKNTPQFQNTNPTIEQALENLQQYLQVAMATTESVNNFHEAGLIHWDLKWNNLLIRRKKTSELKAGDNPFLITLIDFDGAVRHNPYDPEKTKAVALTSYTKGYCAPELKNIRAKPKKSKEEKEEKEEKTSIKPHPSQDAYSIGVTFEKLFKSMVNTANRKVLERIPEVKLIIDRIIELNQQLQNKTDPDQRPQLKDIFTKYQELLIQLQSVIKKAITIQDQVTSILETEGITAETTMETAAERTVVVSAPAVLTLATADTKASKPPMTLTLFFQEHKNAPKIVETRVSDKKTVTPTLPAPAVSPSPALTEAEPKEKDEFKSTTPDIDNFKQQCLNKIKAYIVLLKAEIQTLNDYKAGKNIPSSTRFSMFFKNTDQQLNIKTKKLTIMTDIYSRLLNGMAMQDNVNIRELIDQMRAHNKSISDGIFGSRAENVLREIAEQFSGTLRADTLKGLGL